MGGWTGIAMGAVALATALRGAHMVARPARYFGPREYDAHDPRTVRFFGGFFIIVGAITVLLVVGKAAQG